MTAIIRPNRDWPLRKNGLGFVASTHLINQSPVDPQNITANKRVFIDNLFAPLQARLFPEISPAVAKIRTDTVHPNSVIRFYEHLEGHVSINLRVQLIKTSPGIGITIRGFGVNGIDLDENDADHEEGVLSSLEFPGGVSNQDSRLNMTFDNDAPIPTFPGIEPGVDGAPDRRFIDAGVHMLITTAETIQLVESYATLQVNFTL